MPDDATPDDLPATLVEPQSNAFIMMPAGDNGRYVVVRPHAKGGLGEVFVASDLELGREVALKEMQPRHAQDPGSRERFLREAEITGRLEHPGVVPVYGLGRRSDGAPYYAMRLIRGETLHDAIKAFHAAGPKFESLPFRQLVQRFVAVCQAVAYAHSRGVIHRDLKPSNVMLGPFGEVLVIDWGLARNFDRPAPEANAEPRPDDAEPTLRPSSGSRSDATEMGRAVGTPAYMAPEQAAGRWDVIGPAADVYALGGVLYCLLTDHAPITGANSYEVLQKVQRGDVPPARSVVPALPAALAAIAHKAMALDPANRYATAQALAAECEHFLADESVTAYREPMGARLRRWLRRHGRLAAGLLAASLAGSVTLGVATVLVSAARREAEAQRDVAREQRDVAREQKRRTRTAMDVMISGEMVEQLALQQELSPSQRRFLQDALNYYREFAAEAASDIAGRELLAGAQFRVGSLLATLGQSADAIEPFRAALALYEQLARDEPTVAGRRSDLALTYGKLGNLLSERSDVAGAEAAHRAALKELEQIVADQPKVSRWRNELARTQNSLGSLLRQRGDRSGAAAAYRIALELLDRLVHDEPGVRPWRVALAATHTNLGVLLAENGDRAGGEAAYRKALALQRQLVDEEPAVPARRVSLALTYSNLATLLGSRRDRAGAEEAVRAALALREKLVADEPGIPRRRAELASSHYTLAFLLGGRGDAGGAETACRTSLALRKKLVADEPGVSSRRVELAQTLNYLGLLLNDRGDATGAEAAYRECLALQQQLAQDEPSIPRHRADLAATYNNLGLLMMDRRDQPGAEAAYREALAIFERLAAEEPSLPSRHIDLGAACCNLGSLARVRDARAALALHTRAIAELAPIVKADPRSASARQFLGNCYWARAKDATQLGDHASAIADDDRALEFADAKQRPSLRLERAASFVHVGDHARAATEIDAIAGELTGNDLYEAACVLARCIPHVPGDASDRMAGRAVALLQRASATGFRQVAHLLIDHDLAALRERADYVNLLWDLADGSVGERGREK